MRKARGVHRLARRIHWGRLRLLTLLCAVALALLAVVYGVSDGVRGQQRIAAAQALAGASAQPTARATPTPAVPSTAAPSSATSTSTQPTSAAPPAPPIALPPTAFSWPAAGLSVNVVPMAWTPGQTVDPPLDPNNFDPVAHWLQGSGQSAAIRPVVIAAHACHRLVPLCNDSTFPFNRLSYDGWAVGQPAALTDAHGNVVTCALEDRRVEDKSKEFAFSNDPCLVVVFSCNFENPDGQIVLLTFRCGQCT